MLGDSFQHRQLPARIAIKSDLNPLEAIIFGLAYIFEGLAWQLWLKNQTAPTVMRTLPAHPNHALVIEFNEQNSRQEKRKSEFYLRLQKSTPFQVADMIPPRGQHHIEGKLQETHFPRIIHPR